MIVKNLNDTTDNTCNCDSWLAHWEKYNSTGQAIPSSCSEVSCFQKPEHGAHVQKYYSTDKNWYIIPLCPKHNAQRGELLEISKATSFASANVSETCGSE